MDPKFQTSFIPQRPIIAGGMGTSLPKRPNYLSIVATILFILALLLSAGVFFYSKKLTSDNETKKAQIQQEINAFEPELTRKLSDLKSRIDGAEELLKNHIALTAFFDVLEKNTLSTIVFKDFSFKGGIGKLLSVELNGVAKSYNDVVFQSDTILTSQYLKNPKFSAFALDSLTGDVNFKFNADIDSGLVSYQKAIEALSMPFVPAEPTLPATEQASTSTSTTP